MSADSAFTALVNYWLDDMELEDRLSRTTRQLYERNMRTLVLPFFQDVTLREIGVARCDYFLKQLAKQSYNRARQARVVLRLALGLAVRHEILPRNPMDHVSRLRRPTRSPDVFTWDEIQAIRAAIRDWEKRLILAGPRPDGQLGQIVEVMLGTSARIGEVLAIRVADLDLDAPVPMVRIAGTIVSRKGEPTHRQDHPKTARSVRRVALPGFALRALRARVRSLRFVSPETLLFATRVAGLRTRLTMSVDSSATSWTKPASKTSPRTGSVVPRQPRSTMSEDSNSPPSSSATATPRSPASTTFVATRP